jgi:hypothetical protein
MSNASSMLRSWKSAVKIPIFIRFPFAPFADRVVVRGLPRRDLGGAPAGRFTSIVAENAEFAAGFGQSL